MQRSGELPRTASYTPAWVAVAALAVVALVCVHLGVGSVVLSPTEVAAALIGRAAEPWQTTIVRDLRLPRALVAAVAGAMLGTAGALVQGVTRNVLADPGLLGVSAGAVLGVVGAGSLGLVAPGTPWTPVVATVGAAATGVLVFVLGWRSRGRAGGPDGGAEAMVLHGLLVAAIGSAVVSVLLVLDGSTFGTVLRWVVGSLHARSWPDWAMLWPWALLGLLLTAAVVRSTTVLWCGDDLAVAVGSDLVRVRAAVFGAAVVLTAGAVCAVGAIGFVGLVAAHLVRPLVGGHPARVLPLAAMAGALLLLGADVLANVATVSLSADDVGDQTSLPTGAVTALVGGPLLVALVWRTRR